VFALSCPIIGNQKLTHDPIPADPPNGLHFIVKARIMGSRKTVSKMNADSHNIANKNDHFGIAADVVRAICSAAVYCPPQSNW
jgi:hypothetical protein